MCSETEQARTLEHGETRLLAATLVSVATARQAALGAQEVQCQLWDLAETELVAPLLAAQVLACPDGWEAIRSLAREAMAKATVTEWAQRRALERLVAGLAARGLRFLVVKGAALAGTAYPSAALRPRADTDLLVSPADVDSADRALCELGFTRALEATRAHGSGQKHYQVVDDQGVTHPVDLHWRPTERMAFARALPFDRIWVRSVPLPAMQGARALCDVDALLLALLHRIAHHGDRSCLLWLYDVHLLAGRLDEAEWRDVMRTAEGDDLVACVARGLRQSIALFGTSCPAEVSAWVEQGCHAPLDEAFESRGVRPLAALISDLRAVSSWSMRLALLGEHVFPSADYMRARYRSTRAPLPVLHLRRLAAGVPRWLFR